jgi:hypothetical protein
MMRKSSQLVPYESADSGCRRLRQENSGLRQLLTEHNIPIHFEKLKDKGILFPF